MGADRTLPQEAEAARVVVQTEGPLQGITTAPVATIATEGAVDTAAVVREEEEAEAVVVVQDIGLTLSGTTGPDVAAAATTAGTMIVAEGTMIGGGAGIGSTTDRGTVEGLLRGDEQEGRGTVFFFFLLFLLLHLRGDDQEEEEEETRRRNNEEEREEGEKEE